LSYGWKDSDQYDRAAHYVDKILNGASPTSNPTADELRDARQSEDSKGSGLKIPRTVILQATKSSSSACSTNAADALRRAPSLLPGAPACGALDGGVEPIASG